MAHPSQVRQTNQRRWLQSPRALTDEAVDRARLVWPATPASANAARRNGGINVSIQLSQATRGISVPSRTIVDFALTGDTGAQVA